MLSQQKLLENKESLTCPRFRNAWNTSELDNYITLNETCVYHFEEASFAESGTRLVRCAVKSRRPSVKVEVRNDRCYITDQDTAHGTYIGQALLPTHTETELKRNECFCIGRPVYDISVEELDHQARICWTPYTYVYESAAYVRRDCALKAHAAMRATVVEACTHITVQISPTIKDQMTCSVCHDWYQAPCVINGCGHKFCHACIQEWVAKAQVKPSCPTCRSIVFLTPCFTTEALLCEFLDPHLPAVVINTRREASSVAFAAMREESKKEYCVDGRHEQIGITDPDYSLTLLTETNDQGFVRIAGADIVHDRECAACLKTIPAKFARIVSRSGHHFHCSFPCVYALKAEIKVHGCEVFTDCSAQTRRIFRQTIDYINNTDISF